MDTVEKVEGEVVLSSPMKYEKSNMLIFGRYDMTKMAQKTLAYSLSTLRGRKFSEEEKKDGIKVKFTKNEIQKILVSETTKDRGTLSKELKKIASNLNKKTVFIQGEDDTSNFVSFTLIKTCEYYDGEFTLTFHEKMSPYLVNLEKNFTVLDVNHVKIMSSSYTIRMYELCESLAYQARAHNGRISKDFNFVEIRLMLGMIDSEDSNIKDITDKYGTNYDKIGEEVELLCKQKEITVSVLQKEIENIDKSDIPQLEKENKKTAIRTEIKKIQNMSKYRNPSEFRKKVLNVAREELKEKIENDIIDICFDYEVIKKNHSISGFKLTIMTKEGYKASKKSKEDSYQITMDEYMSVNDTEVEIAPEKVLTEDMKDMVLDEISELIKEKIRIKDIRLIAEKANYNIEDVKKAYAVMSSSRSKIENVVGFMLKAIEDGYSDPVEKVPPCNFDNKFNNFSQREYDYDSLEKILKN